jgi:hypothetical protein
MCASDELHALGDDGLGVFDHKVAVVRGDHGLNGLNEALRLDGLNDLNS